MAVSDDSLSERIAAGSEDSHVTLDVGLASEQLVFRIKATSPFPPNKRSNNPGSGIISENHRTTC